MDRRDFVPTRVFFAVAVALMLFASFALGQPTERESIASLIKKLGSSDFQQRLAATKALKDRPAAAPLLRQSMQTLDLETRQRAAEILDYHDRTLVRELNDALKDGRMDAFVEVLARWPSGKFADEAWIAVRHLAKDLARAHEKQGGQKMNLTVDRFPDSLPPVFRTKRADENTKCQDDRIHFLWADEVDLDGRRRKPGSAKSNDFETSAAVFAASNLRMFAQSAQVIFTGGSVELVGEGALTDTIIVSAGDVTLDCHLINSLVIARGKVICSGALENTRIISGKWIHAAREPKNCTLTEDELNPLGIIRWPERPKKKLVVDLKTAAATGRVEDFVHLMATWPAQDDDDEALHLTRSLAARLVNLHIKKGGEPIDIRDDVWHGQTPPVHSAKRVTESTKCADDRFYFLRVTQLDLDRARLKPGTRAQNGFEHSPVIVATDSVSMRAWRSHLIFSGGLINLDDGGVGVSDSVIVSGGDVTLGCQIRDSLVIARGKVNCDDIEMKNCRIISGKSVAYDKKMATNCIITENESNPFGYIRWSEPAKEKPAPMSK